MSLERCTKTNESSLQMSLDRCTKQMSQRGDESREVYKKGVQNK